MGWNNHNNKHFNVFRRNVYNFHCEVSKEGDVISLNFDGKLYPATKYFLTSLNQSERDFVENAEFSGGIKFCIEELKNA